MLDGALIAWTCVRQRPRKVASTRHARSLCLRFNVRRSQHHGALRLCNLIWTVTKRLTSMGAIVSWMPSTASENIVCWQLAEES